VWFEKTSARSASPVPGASPLVLGWWWDASGRGALGTTTSWPGSCPGQPHARATPLTSSGLGCITTTLRHTYHHCHRTARQ
jgi:hypothetical protein